MGKTFVSFVYVSWVLWLMSSIELMRKNKQWFYKQVGFKVVIITLFEKGVALHLNKLESLSLKDALCYTLPGGSGEHSLQTVGQQTTCNQKILTWTVIHFENGHHAWVRQTPLNKNYESQAKINESKFYFRKKYIKQAGKCSKGSLFREWINWKWQWTEKTQKFR